MLDIILFLFLVGHSHQKPSFPPFPSKSFEAPHVFLLPPKAVDWFAQ